MGAKRAASGMVWLTFEHRYLGPVAILKVSIIQDGGLLNQRQRITSWGYGSGEKWPDDLAKASSGKTYFKRLMKDQDGIQS